MKIICFCILFFGGVNLSAAEILRELECHDKVVQHGLGSLRCADEVSSLFGVTNVDHFISSFGSKTHKPVWNSVVFFANRYRLSLQFTIAIDYENCRITGKSEAATIQINEVTEVELSASGDAGATMRGQWRLNEEEWKRFVSSRGDWAVVNVPIRTNAPVKRFDEYVRQARAPVRNRKEGFDIPVSKAIKASRDRNENLPDGNQDRKTPTATVANGFDCYEKVLRHGLDSLILPGEINSLFGITNVDHFISKFGSKTQIPVWHSVAYFLGRYRFMLQVPISVDYENCRLNGAMNSAMIQVDEITSVDMTKSGTAGATTNRQWTLGQSEWKWLVKNNGDWAVVKVPIQTNAFIKGFSNYVREERGRPLLDRQADFDRFIRKAIDALRYPGGDGSTRQNRR